jgi:hypothetical protein
MIDVFSERLKRLILPAAWTELREFLDLIDTQEKTGVPSFVHKPQ